MSAEPYRTSNRCLWRDALSLGSKDTQRDATIRATVQHVCGFSPWAMVFVPGDVIVKRLGGHAIAGSNTDAPNLPRLPIVAANTRHSACTKSLGVDTFIRPPFRYAALRACIGQCFVGDRRRLGGGLSDKYCIAGHPGVIQQMRWSP